MQQFKLRTIDLDSDLSFIYSSWLKSFKGSRFAKPIDADKYYAAQHDLVEAALKRSKVVVACNHEDQSQIYGWVCVEPHCQYPIVHYVYVKHPYRSLGIGKALLEEASHHGYFFFTHDTGAIQKMSELCTYNPYLFFKGEQS
jgi:GNAT superfamily N-acetyltransferase